MLYAFKPFKCGFVAVKVLNGIKEHEEGTHDRIFRNICFFFINENVSSFIFLVVFFSREA